jgi:hypothetical protein
VTLQIVHDPLVPNHVLAEWALERLPADELEDINELGPYVAFGVIKDGKAVCVVLYNWFRIMREGNDCRVIIVADDPSWCLPGVLAELFRYPFEVAGCVRLTAIIRDGNTRSLKLCKGLGFRQEGVLRRGHNGKTNAIILGMLKEECKWLQRSHNRGQQANGKEIFSSPTETSRPNGNGKRPGRRKQRRDDRVRADQRDQHLRAAGERDLRSVRPKRRTEGAVH